jgi:hypothetical protein
MKYSNCQAFATFPSVWRPTGLRQVSRSAITAKNLGISGLTAGNLHIVCGEGAATCTRSVLRRETLLQLQLAVTGSWQRERKPALPIIGAADTPRRRCRKEDTEDTQTDKEEGVFLKTHHTRCVLCCGAPRQ